MTGNWLSRTGDGNRKLNPRVTPRRIAAVKLANLKKLFPMVRGEMNNSVNIMPTPSCEKRKKNVDEIIFELGMADAERRPASQVFLGRPSNSIAFIGNLAIHQHKELPQ